ncbi:MAG TPA: class II aldolase/adducin family protein [Candidatus Acidoferrales bacterium]|nr:class II aldolase/adducin family protein [Candidatus Acidoferrales bacterium]
MTASTDDLRRKVAISCRILGMLGLVNESTGHVSARIPGADEMWIRCRGGDECGLTFTGLHNIRRLDFDGKGPGLGDNHAAPDETPIHGEIYRARPEVAAVVHAHPYYALLCGVTELEFRPVFGAYDPPSLDIVLKGVPVFPRAVTVTNKELAAAMLKSMGERDVLLMRGHGITVTGPSVEQATTLAIRFNRVAKIMWEIALSGRHAPVLSDEDMARYDGRERPARAGWRAKLQGAENFAWNHYVKLLEANNIGLPEDAEPD